MSFLVLCCDGAIYRMNFRHFIYSFLSLSIAFIYLSVLYAEDHILMIHVKNTKGKPIPGVKLTTRGPGSGYPTDRNGKARIRLANETQPGCLVSLQIEWVSSGRDLVFISPWDGRVRVPPFENESENYESIVLAEYGDRALLEIREALVTMAARINALRTTKPTSKNIIGIETKEALKIVSREYGLDPDEVDSAIIKWGRKTQNLFEKGLFYLYEQKYEEAERFFRDALRQEEKQYKAALSKEIDALIFLGHSYYHQDKYKKALERYIKATKLVLKLENL